jgi:hypothetical protein
MRAGYGAGRLGDDGIAADIGLDEVSQRQGRPLDADDALAGVDGVQPGVLVGRERPEGADDRRGQLIEDNVTLLVHGRCPGMKDERVAVLEDREFLDRQAAHHRRGLLFRHHLPPQQSTSTARRTLHHVKTLRGDQFVPPRGV